MRARLDERARFIWDEAAVGAADVSLCLRADLIISSLKVWARSVYVLSGITREENVLFVREAFKFTI